jgi:alpha-galactosidase
MKFRKIPALKYLIPCLLLLPLIGSAQKITRYNDSLVVSINESSVSVNYKTGYVSYHFSNGVVLNNTIAYVNDISSGYLATADCKIHQAATDTFTNSAGKGIRMVIKHSGNDKGISLVQQIFCYADHPYILVNLTAMKEGRTTDLETRDICALAVLPQQQGSLSQPGTEPRFLDVPFDNDDWTKVLENKWDGVTHKSFSGISYEYASIYDNHSLSGLVMGSLSHDFWKTGIVYHSSAQTGVIDSLKIYDGAATEDNPKLPAAYGGQDGTHDHVPHGTMIGEMVNSSIIYLCGLADVRKAFVDYGNINVIFNGKQTWKGAAPVYWNSFGVEGVLGYEHVMMPKDVLKITDFLQTLPNFNAHAKPVLSIDSYDQSVYTTELLASLGKYAEKRNMQMGFYFIPFAMWTWRNSFDNKLAGSDYTLADVVLRDKVGQPIAYKDGDWGAYAMDPTHPAVRLYVINQLKKAKAIGAKFIKIDFLTAGALESTTRYNPQVRTGLQAYNYGMKMLRSLVDSLMGPDIFITQAISPMFPSQYADTRFVSTDVYSHLRDDEPNFPHWGSTEASLATGSFAWWVQGTLWPYTNLDVSIMKNFQKNPDLSETEVKVRLYAMMSMGSILGDGSDFRNPLAAERAKKYLDNKNITDFFSAPKAFTPLQFADGESLDQQMAFYLPGNEILLSLFNFDKQKIYSRQWHRADLNLENKTYLIKDFLTDSPLGKIEKGQDTFSLDVPVADALMVKLVPQN